MYNNPQRTTLNGFTLIELLVVISIIGLLSSIVLASLNTAKDKANDARRYSDLHQLTVALELYANDHNGLYPLSATYTVSTDLAVLAPSYIKIIPNDPDTTQRYWYCTNASNSVYTLLAYTSKGTFCSISTGTDACGWSIRTRCGQ